MAAGKTGLKQKFDSKSDGEKAAVAQHDKIVYSSINVNFIERFTSTLVKLSDTTVPNDDIRCCVVCE